MNTLPSLPDIALPAHLKLLYDRTHAAIQEIIKNSPEIYCKPQPTNFSPSCDFYMPIPEPVSIDNYNQSPKPCIIPTLQHPHYFIPYLSATNPPKVPTHQQPTGLFTETKFIKDTDNTKGPINTDCSRLNIPLYSTSEDIQPLPTAAHPSYKQRADFLNYQEYRKAAMKEENLTAFYNAPTLMNLGISPLSFDYSTVALLIKRIEDRFTKGIKRHDYLQKAPKPSKNNLQLLQEVDIPTPSYYSAKETKPHVVFTSNKESTLPNSRHYGGPKVDIQNLFVLLIPHKYYLENSLENTPHPKALLYIHPDWFKETINKQAQYIHQYLGITSLSQQEVNNDPDNLVMPVNYQTTASLLEYNLHSVLNQNHLPQIPMYNKDYNKEVDITNLTCTILFSPIDKDDKEYRKIVASNEISFNRSGISRYRQGNIKYISKHDGNYYKISLTNPKMPSYFESKDILDEDSYQLLLQYLNKQSIVDHNYQLNRLQLGRCTLFFDMYYSPSNPHQLILHNYRKIFKLNLDNKNPSHKDLIDHLPTLPEFNLQKLLVGELNNTRRRV